MYMHVFFTEWKAFVLVITTSCLRTKIVSKNKKNWAPGFDINYKTKTEANVIYISIYLHSYYFIKTILNISMSVFD